MKTRNLDVFFNAVIFSSQCQKIKKHRNITVTLLFDFDIFSCYPFVFYRKLLQGTYGNTSGMHGMRPLTLVAVLEEPHNGNWEPGQPVYGISYVIKVR